MARTRVRTDDRTASGNRREPSDGLSSNEVLEDIRRATDEGRLAFGYMFERIGEVRLKGFSDLTEIFLARQKAEGVQ